MKFEDLPEQCKNCGNLRIGHVTMSMKNQYSCMKVPAFLKNKEPDCKAARTVKIIATRFRQENKMYRENDVLMAFSILDDWIDKHPLKGDCEDIEDAMKTIHALVLKEIGTSKN